MKRLFIIQHESIAAKYGIGTYVKQLINCFDLEEWKVTVVELFVLTQEFVAEEKDGINYYRFPVYREQGYGSHSVSRDKYERGIFYLLATQTFSSDSIYCHFNFVYDYELAMLFKERLHAKIVMTLHYMDWSFDLLGDRNWFLRILQNPIGLKDQNIVKRFEVEKRFMQECCDRVIAIANHSYETLHTLYEIPKAKLKYIPNALKDEYIKRTNEERIALRAKYGFGNQERIIIFTGRLNLIKGIIELINAFKLVMNELSDVRLIIAGDQNFQGCFEAAAPCWSRIVFMGFVPKEQLFELYAIADVGVVPSIHEEFGYVAVEMMMNNLPLIVSNTTGLREVTREGKYALLVDMDQKDNRVEHLKQGIIEWFNENRLVALGRERFKKEYDLEGFRQKIKLLYQELQ